MDSVNLLLNSAHGVYIPSLFIETMKDDYLINITEEQKTDLSDNNSECYWDTWNDILDGYSVSIDNKEYTLHHDGDLWLICYEDMTSEEKTNFGFDEY